MPDPKVLTAVDLAKRVGTYGKLDRSKQYEGRYSAEVLLRNDNLQFKKLRQLERMQMRNNVIMLVTAALTLITAVITRGAMAMELMRRAIGR